VATTKDETLAIAAALRTTRPRTRSPTAATASAARPPLSTRSIRSLAAGDCRNYGNPIGAVEVWLFSRLFSLIVEIIPVLINVVRDLLRARRSSGFNPPYIRANLTRLRQTKLGALLAQNRLPRKLNPIPFDSKDLHQNLIAFTKLVFYFLNAMFCDLGDMQQAIRSREDFNERAELSQAQP
jgi:hypothetical protein